MSAEEFKAWFLGFKAALGDETPDPNQWDLICKQVSTIIIKPPQSLLLQRDIVNTPKWNPGEVYKNFQQPTFECKPLGSD